MQCGALSPDQRRRLSDGFRDHEQFCRASLRLRDRVGDAVPLSMWPSQRKLAAIVKRQQDRRQPVRVLILKTRRSGFTVGSCSHVFKETAFLGRQGFIIADKYRPAALEAFSYLKAFASDYVPFGQPGQTIMLPDLRIVEGDLAIKQGDRTLLDVYSADIGEIRGGGRNWALFDEVAFWRNPAITLRSAMNMVPDLPETGIFVQSTANGVGGEFYDMCQRAQDPALAEGFEFLFFGWLEDENNRKAFEHPDDAVRLQRDLDSEEHRLHTMHGATLEHLHWRRWKIRTNFAGRIDDFHQEYPTTPEEAFLTSGRPALDHQALAAMPVSEGISGEAELVEVYPRKRVVFTYRQHGPLTIWRKPVPSDTYVIGADPSRGIDVSESQRGDDPDYSVGFVLNQAGEQVALLRERMRPATFADALALLGRLYNDAYLVPEANDAGFIDALIRTNYPTHLIYCRQRSPDDLRPPIPGEIGFETTNVTRPQLVAAIDEAIRGRDLTIHSSVVISECRTFVIKPNGKAEHQTGCHDDCVMAAALAVIGLRYAPAVMRVARQIKESGGRPVRYGQKAQHDEEDAWRWK